MLDVVRGAASEAGRTPLVEEARRRARDAVMIAKTAAYHSSKSVL